MPGFEPLLSREKRMDVGLLEEFRFDWELAGKAARTVDDYIAALRLLFAGSPEPDLGAAKAWMRRLRARRCGESAPRRSERSVGGERGPVRLCSRGGKKCPWWSKSSGPSRQQQKPIIGLPGGKPRRFEIAPSSSCCGRVGFAEGS